MTDRIIENYICTQCGNRGNTSNIILKNGRADDKVRSEQLENMEIKVRDHNIKKSVIPFIKTKQWDVQIVYDKVLKKDFWMICENSGMSYTGYVMWKPVTKDRVSSKGDFLYIDCPKCKERVYL